MRTKLDALSSEFDTVKTRITNIDREIDDNERAMRDITASRYYNRYYGRTVLPSRYYDLEADNQAKLETTLKQWMRTKIKQIEDERADREAREPATV